MLNEQVFVYRADLVTTFKLALSIISGLDMKCKQLLRLFLKYMKLQESSVETVRIANDCTVSEQNSLGKKDKNSSDNQKNLNKPVT